LRNAHQRTVRFRSFLDPTVLPLLRNASSGCPQGAPVLRNWSPRTMPRRTHRANMYLRLVSPVNFYLLPVHMLMLHTDNMTYRRSCPDPRQRLTQVREEYQSQHSVCLYFSHDRIRSVCRVRCEELVTARTRDALLEDLRCSKSDHTRSKGVRYTTFEFIKCTLV
jgi:hypothetical protein